MRLFCGAIVMFALILVSAFVSAFSIQKARAASFIYIRADGSVDPPTAPISNVGNAYYKFTADIYDSNIWIQRGNIVVDGAGHTLQMRGPFGGSGFRWTSIDNVAIRNTNIRRFEEGIWLESSSGSSISGNNITANGDGIDLDYFSDYDSISGNNITGNIWNDIYVHASSGYNSISENIIAHSACGIRIDSSYQNTIFHNNFIDNTDQVICNSANFWDDGYPSGGNYWDDHVGTDLYSGPYQNIPGSDGIGDTPRVIYTGVTVTDHYPLMEPRPPTVHDVAVTNVSPSKTVVGQGYDAKFNVTVENQGDFTETFNLDAYANATRIGTQLVSNLPVGEMRMYTFVWNTAGLAYGNYTISATAAQVTGELDTADNTFVDGVVKVTIAGDVDGDFDVDIMDVVSITGRYMRPVPLWWPGPPALPNDNNCDINGDGVISILDVVICTSHYGQKWP